jgi:hypothetical protein
LGFAREAMGLDFGVNHRSSRPGKPVGMPWSAHQLQPSTDTR